MAKKIIGIFTLRVARFPPWDPDSIQQGIPGSEEAAIYAAQELAKLGHQVYVFNQSPQGSKYRLPSANPRYMDDLPDDLYFDVMIISRFADIVQYLKGRGKKIYFWPHDLPNYRIRDELIRQYDDVLWLSSSQRDLWVSMNPPLAQFSKIFGNGIEPNQFKKVKERENPYACIYGSNYARGLSLLLDIWPSVKAAYPRAILDIYYGWQNYGLMPEAQEHKMRCQIADLEKLGVKERGRVGHEELAEAYNQASFWTYPCIYPEMFCITAIKAQAAGAIPVIIDGYALQEVVRYGFRCTRTEEYLSLLLHALSQAETIQLQARSEMGQFIFDEFTWDKIIMKWNRLFHDESLV